MSLSRNFLLIIFMPTGRAAAGGSVDELSIALQMVLMLEKVECRLK